MSTLGETDSSTALHPGATVRSEKARKEYEAEKQKEQEQYAKGARGNAPEQRNSSRQNTSEVTTVEDVQFQKGGQQGQEKTVSEFAKELEEEEKRNNNKKGKKD